MYQQRAKLSSAAPSSNYYYNHQSQEAAANFYRRQCLKPNPCYDYWKKPYFNYKLRMFLGHQLRYEIIHEYFYKYGFQPLEVIWNKDAGSIVCRREFLHHFHQINGCTIQSEVCIPQPREDPRVGLGVYATINSSEPSKPVEEPVAVAARPEVTKVLLNRTNTPSLPSKLTNEEWKIKRRQRRKTII